MWQQLARPNQQPPCDPWTIWLILAGRGFGKTRTGAETVKLLIKQNQVKNIALIGQTLHETTSIMVEGHSGLLQCFKKAPQFLKSKRTILWDNGAKAMLFGGDHYESLRGPQFDCAWIDEFAKFRCPEALWFQLSMTLRLGTYPKCIITTTPRPIPILHELIKDKDIRLTTGSTFDNADNLSPYFIERVKKLYGDTKIGRQELDGVLLECQEGLLWRKSFFHYQKPDGNLSRIVIGVDPAVSHHDTSSETGIIVAGRDYGGCGYILEDLSGKYSPQHWAGLVIELFYRYKADRIVAEVNNGGDLVAQVLRAQDARIAFKAVRATRGKIVRAEPVVALYEQGRIFHVRYFEALEKQMLVYEPGGPSPDRMDAAVWCLHELFLGERLGCHISVV